jgi:hypothetical protein
MRKLVVAAALAGLALPAHLHAQPAPPPTELWKPAVTPPAPKHAPRHLFISPSGEPFRGHNGFSAWFAQADTDHDGAISAAEFQADAERAFKLYDTNGDGVIDGFELQTYERTMVPEITEFAVGGGEFGGGRHNAGHRHRGADDLGPNAGERAGDVQGAGGTGASRFSLLNEPEPLTAADLNVDGKITHAEWMQATTRRFAKLDTAHTGKLTLDTLQPPANTKVKAGKGG